MSDKTNIAWTDYTWSPWLGCRKVSPGCENCYITSTPIFKFRKIKHGDKRVRTSFSYWAQPIKWNRLSAAQATKAAAIGGTYRKPRVFPSLCDPFDPEVTLTWFMDFMAVVMQTPHLHWLLLTKRPQFVMHRWHQLCACLDAESEELPGNVWLGVSCEDQKRADERIPILLSIPARVRFLSVEPMLERIDLTKVECWRTAETGMLPDGAKAELAIDWVIFGGESGKNARPCNIEWIRDGVRQCKEAGVAAFVKQLGSNTILEPGPLTYPCEHPKGGDPSEWPEDLRVREFPKACIELSTPPPRVC